MVDHPFPYYLLPLSLHSRPATSFLWFTSPWKTFKFIIWRTYKWWIIGILIAIVVLIIVAIFIYTSPVSALIRVLLYAGLLMEFLQVWGFNLSATSTGLKGMLISVGFNWSTSYAALLEWVLIRVATASGL